jgi:pimeloyl-ACP methyl ester carboxylesterase
MAYWEWNATGDAHCPHVVLCVHGLSRQGRDFDTLARALVAQSKSPLRVICPDVVGRGRSDWLTDPMGYQIPNYAADMLALLAQLKPTTLDWVGTSMGGLIGMVVAGQPGLPLSAPVRRLLLNDVGPSVQWAAIQRIGQYLGNTGHFKTVQDAADAMWAASTTFGPHSAEQWLALSRPMVREVPGGFTLHYDPAIAVPVAQMTREMAEQGDATLWQLYDQISARTLVTRGAQSDLLTAQTAAEMTQRGPRARIVEFAGVGHAPTFVAPDQVAAATSFLLE